jgi:hypothetical protein
MNVMPTAGERFVLTANVDRYPHFIAVRGSVGTVTEVTDLVVCLRLDDLLPGAEEWDNEVVWSLDEGQDFWRDVERLSS